AKENGDEDLQDVTEQDYRRHFMNIISDWVVTFDNGTRDLRFKLPNTDDDDDDDESTSVSSSSHAYSPPSRHAYSLHAYSPPAYSPRRKHVRTVFAEVCETIFEVQDVRSMIMTLRGVTKGTLGTLICLRGIDITP
ncbi:hypothetical protein H0H92_000565, partial [Tricholoma furcatifolium]